MEYFWGAKNNDFKTYKLRFLTVLRAAFLWRIHLAAFYYNNLVNTKYRIK